MGAISVPRSRPQPTLIAAAMLAAMAFFALSSQRVDPDLFWHLKVAELIRASGPQPFVDAFSYNSNADPWLPYSWLGELVMQTAVSALGGYGLILLRLIPYLAFVFFVTLIVGERTDAFLKSVAIVSAVAVTTLPFMAARPAALTFPFCAFSAWAVMGEGRTRGRRLALVALVPLTALFANVHLFFLFAPLMLLAWAGGTVLEDGVPRGAAWRRSLAYGGLAVAALAAALIANPFGPRLLTVVTHYVFRDAMVRSGAIIEMKPFFQLSGLVMAGTTVLIVWPAAGLIQRRPIPRRDALLLALAVALVLMRGRYVPLAACLLAPATASYAPWPRLSAAAHRHVSALATAALVALAVTAGRLWLAHPVPRDLDSYVQSRGGYPVAAARFVGDSVQAQSGRLINEMCWGGYLIHALWPEYQVMLDGRTQVYPEAVWRACYLHPCPDSLRSFFSRCEANLAILAPGSSWGAILERHLDWERLYADDVAVVWGRDRLRR
jgi:hypothetical protein